MRVDGNAGNHACQLSIGSHLLSFKVAMPRTCCLKKRKKDGRTKKTQKITQFNIVLDGKSFNFTLTQHMDEFAITNQCHGQIESNSGCQLPTSDHLTRDLRKCLARDRFAIN